ncbi:hypothetical protein PFY12_10455 [Chryseobacterium camelliae]|uniref:Uncharacterized protein n=1 Tax=Chryseobacterium camelliae TaxID=1265445 RepID=A0ABY7QIM2_9FLAO|nr:hypothetical protein [Chryseobacterium camelliae]WBV59479.1 hypothetical protein PFY12_10455 [Chryseobacterium camelliae]
MKIKTLYQTLENRDNPDYVEENGAFSCNWQNTWLGDGYYFWDTFIENAHWWGEMRYSSNYFICKAICDFDNEKCFDLVGDTEHMMDFDNCVNFLREQNLLNEKSTVASIIRFIKEKVGGFNYEAIRAMGIKSISEYKNEYKRYLYRFKFEIDKSPYLDYKPAIQICIFEKRGLNLRDYRIEYPEEYCMGPL